METEVLLIEIGAGAGEGSFAFGGVTEGLGGEQTVGAELEGNDVQSADGGGIEAVVVGTEEGVVLGRATALGEQAKGIRNAHGKGWNGIDDNDVLADVGETLGSAFKAGEELLRIGIAGVALVIGNHDDGFDAAVAAQTVEQLLVAFGTGRVIASLESQGWRAG